MAYLYPELPSLMYGYGKSEKREQGQVKVQELQTHMEINVVYDVCQLTIGIQKRTCY